MEQPNGGMNADRQAVCWNCAGVISSADHYCRFCGMGQGSFIPWYYRHWGIIVATLFGLGPFGLWFAWRSPVVSRTAKIVYTIVIGVLTWYVAYVIYGYVTTILAIMSGFSGSMPAVPGQ